MKKIIFFFFFIIGCSSKHSLNENVNYIMYKNTGENESEFISKEEMIQMLKHFYLELSYGSIKPLEVASQPSGNLTDYIINALNNNEESFLEILNKIELEETENLNNLNLRLNSAKKIIENALKNEKININNEGESTKIIQIDLKAHSGYRSAYFSSPLIKIMESLFMGIKNKEKVSNEFDSKNSANEMINLIKNLFLNYKKENLKALKNLKIEGENFTCVNFKNARKLAVSFVENTISSFKGEVEKYFRFCIEAFEGILSKNLDEINSMLENIKDERSNYDKAYGSSIHKYFAEKKLAFYLSKLEKATE